MTFSVMIPSVGRCSHLRLTCQLLRQLNPSPEEIVVCLDGCADASAVMLRRDFPEITVLTHEKPQGSVSSRDRLMRFCRSDIVISLDDDSHPMQSDFLPRLETCLQRHPEAAVVSFAERRMDGTYSAPDKSARSEGHYVSSFANCASAIRRKFYLEQPGFPEFFEHMYEEPDFALQCYAAGAGVWFEPSIVVAHRQAHSKLALRSRHLFHACNELWSVWLRCPLAALPFVSTYRVVREMIYACSQGPGWILQESSWWLRSVKGAPVCFRRRQVVPWRVYLFWMRLARNPASTWGQVLARIGSSNRSAVAHAETGVCVPMVK